ncbi:MAG: hypothetical protein R3F55_00450 [Alphaproteobacteria bacterium]
MSRPAGKAAARRLLRPLAVAGRSALGLVRIGQAGLSGLLLALLHPMRTVRWLRPRLARAGGGGVARGAVRMVRRIDRFPFTLLDTAINAHRRAWRLQTGNQAGAVAVARTAGGPDAPRDFLIAQARQCAAARSAGRSAVDQILLLDGDAAPAADFLTLFALNPLGRDFATYRDRDRLQAELPFAATGAVPVEDIDATGAAAAVAHFVDGGGAALELPSGIAQAHATVQLLGVDATLVACSLPPPADGPDAFARDWAPFFAALQRLVPDAQCVLLGDWPWPQPPDFGLAVPPRLAVRYGLDRLGRMALARQADLFVGRYDAYAAAVAGIATPALVLYDGDPAQAGATLRPRPHQWLVGAPCTPDALVAALAAFRAGDAPGARQRVGGTAQ